jgi:hypothetical protein
MGSVCPAGSLELQDGTGFVESLLTDESVMASCIKARFGLGEYCAKLLHVTCFHSQASLFNLSTFSLLRLF